MCPMFVQRSTSSWDCCWACCRFERQEAEDQLSKLEDEQRLKAQKEENAKHLPKDPMAEMEEALAT